MRAALLIVVACLTADAVRAQADATKYKCGSECDEKKMGSDLPDADSMPHDFGNLPLGEEELHRAMNSLTTEMPPHSLIPEEMAPRPHAIMPESVVIKPFQQYSPEAVMGLEAVQPKTVPDHLRLPYEKFPDQPALRRPCNLDEVLELLKTVKNDYMREEDHDSKLHEAKSEGQLALSAAKVAVEKAEDDLKEMEQAKKANTTLSHTLESIALKAEVLEQHLSIKAGLTQEEGTMKAPIVKAIGRTNINLQAALTAKQGALNDFAQHPAFTKEEMAEIISTYDELIISIKKQLEQLHKQATDVLTPIQLNINQTENVIERVRSEMIDLRSEQDRLTPIAQKYTPLGLEAARAILGEVTAHYKAEKEAHTLDVAAYDQRTKDRSEIIHLTDKLILLVGDIQEPQDPTHKFVEAPPVQSLSGSIPGKPIYTQPLQPGYQPGAFPYHRKQ